MTLVTLPRPAFFSEICRRQISHAARACAAQFFEWRRRARSRRELTQLCDRDFQDLGWTRGDAEAEAAKPFWQE